jgi:hypothetical protein
MSYFDDNEDYFIYGRILPAFVRENKKEIIFMTTKTTHVMRARLDWAKVLGTPVLNKFSQEREYSLDATPIRKSDRDEIASIGIADRLKTPKADDTRKETFIHFRQREFRTDKNGEKVKNDPIKIVDVTGQPWGDKLLGNGTVADVKYTVVDYGPGKHKGVYMAAIRVLDHVEYESQDFAPLSEDDEYFANRESGTEASDAKVDTPDSAGNTPNPDELDDDIPF